MCLTLLLFYDLAKLGQFKNLGPYCFCDETLHVAAQLKIKIEIRDYLLGECQLNQLVIRNWKLNQNTFELNNVSIK